MNAEFEYDLRMTHDGRYVATWQEGNTVRCITARSYTDIIAALSTARDIWVERERRRIQS